MFIPDHEHRVSVDLTHYEVGAAYGLRENAQLSLRLPYDVKAMRVRYTTLTGAPFDPPYGDIHHRTETLRGISDPSLLLEWSPHEAWIASAGTTIPLGRTEPDPVRLGTLGIRHQHIQFGSGTFQPKLALQWSRLGRVDFFARAEGTISVYESDKGFRAPSILSASFGPSFRAARLIVAPRLDFQSQGIGRWHGEEDEGSGFRNGGVALQIAMPLQGFNLTSSVYRELWSSASNGQTFRQGTTWSVGVARTVGR
jgi:hypothetical protein